MSTPPLPPRGLLRTAGRSWWLILLFGVASVLFGLLAVFDPVRAGVSLTWAVGALAVVEGVGSLVSALRNDGNLPRGWGLAYAVISLVFGVMAMLNPASMAEAMGLVMGCWLIAAGVLRIVLAVRVRKEVRGEWLLILSGVLAVVLGGLLLAVPMSAMVLAVVWIGIGAVLYGLFQIMAAFKIRKLAKL